MKEKEVVEVVGEVVKEELIESVESIKYNKDKLLSTKVGTKFKNYVELCEYLEADVLDSNSKNAQLKEWRRYVNLRKNKNNSYTIKEIYGQPLEKMDKRKFGNNVIYMELIELTLLYYLYENMHTEGDSICLSRSSLYDILGFVNNNYILEFLRKYRVDSEHQKNVSKLKEEHNITNFDLYNFYEHSSHRFNEILNRAFSDLGKQSILLIKPVFIITEFDETEENMELKDEVLEKLKTEKLDDMQMYELLNQFEYKTSRVASEDDMKYILSINRMTLDEFEYRYMYDVYRNNERFNFYKELTIKLLEDMNWIFCYKAYQFSFTESTLQSGIRIYKRSIENYKNNRLELNGILRDAINTNAETVYNNQLAKEDRLRNMIDSMLNDRVFRYKDNYVEIRKILVDYFMTLEEE